MAYQNKVHNMWKIIIANSIIPIACFGMVYLLIQEDHNTWAIIFFILGLLCIPLTKDKN